MSHFTVLVIGPDHEKQLAPYDETKEAAPTRENLDLTDIQRMVEHYQAKTPGPKTTAGKALRVVYPDGVLPLVIVEGVVEHPTHNVLRALYQEWNGRDLHHDAQGYYHYTTYNPDSKWDWYQIGGRWTGYFKKKPTPARRIDLDDHAAEVEDITAVGEPGVFGHRAEPGWVDVCRKGDVDVEGMRGEAGDKAAAHWDAVRAVVLQHTDDPASIESWEALSLRVAGARPAPLDEAAMEAWRAKVDEARALYHAQPVIQALAELVGPFGDEDVIHASRETWIQQARDAALTPFAVVKDGVWYQKGRMGWWGMVSDEQDAAAWNTQFTDLFDALPDETELTLIDAHI